MKEDKIDQEIRSKLHERTIQPSTSAWERLSCQLDDVEQKKKRHWFFYVGYAASIALIVSLFFLWTQGDEKEPQLPEVLVQEEVETPQVDTTKEFHSLPVEGNAIVQNDNVETRDLETGLRQAQSDRKENSKKAIQKDSSFKGMEDNSVIAQKKQPDASKVDVNETIKKLTQQEETTIVSTDSAFIQKKGSNTRISVSSDALLMSVTGTREEVRAYYKKYKIDRAEVLATIEKELKKSSLKVDPQTILAEVEQDVNEENFQNNFYQFIKKRVSSVATAIANRNN
jgi:hypothetical protein